MLIDVIGNGPGNINITPDSSLVVFNEAEFSIKPSLHVLNGKLFGNELGFVIQGKLAAIGIEDKFKQLATELSESLRVWPSSGLVTLYYLIENFENIKVQRMDLLPSIARPATLEPRKPLPCIYHNWLSERRFALKHIFSQCHWPQLQIDKPSTGTKSHKNPFDLLMTLAETPRGSDVPKYLSEITAESWLANASSAYIQSVEHLFYLVRHTKETPNWWLFDYEGSCAMAKIHRMLAWCEQELLLKTVY